MLVLALWRATPRYRAKNLPELFKTLAMYCDGTKEERFAMSGKRT